MRFFVQGVPIPKGSTHSFKHKHTGAIITMATNAKAQKGWRERIYSDARGHFAAPTAEAVGVNVVFLFDRPKGHFGKKGILPSAPKHKTTTPDVDKLLRCVLDALTDVAWHDDSQVISVYGRKQFCEPGGSSGAWIEVAVDVTPPGPDPEAPKPYSTAAEGLVADFPSLDGAGEEEDDCDDDDHYPGLTEDKP